MSNIWAKGWSKTTVSRLEKWCMGAKGAVMRVCVIDSLSVWEEIGGFG